MSNRAGKAGETVTMLCWALDEPPTAVVLKIRDIRLQPRREGRSFEEAANELMIERCPICNRADS
jgi:hypothetical protein